MREQAVSCLVFSDDRRTPKAGGEQPAGVMERPHQQVLYAGELGTFAAEPELQFLASVRHIQCSERPIPKRKTETEILAEVARRCAVVDVMVGRALDDVTEP